MSPTTRRLRVRDAVETLTRNTRLETPDAQRPSPDKIYRAAVRVVLRLVVVLFAEGRGLLPVNNAIYRDSYGLHPLARQLADRRRREGVGGPVSRGAWPRVLALWRLLWEGCAHPLLAIRAYGGDLLRPGRPDGDPLERALALFERPGSGPDDTAVGEILTHLGAGSGVDFGSLSLDAIGSLYEELLDFSLAPEASANGEPGLVRESVVRKRSGSFYTPALLADSVVRQTLAPLCRAGTGDAAVRPCEELLGLQVCDPAMGSGAFLGAALRYLTRAVLDSLAHHQRLPAPGTEGPVAVRLTPDCVVELPCGPDEAGFASLLESHVKRHVVERCLYGVDLDPLSVELARVTLWLETMDPRLPFTFLDHKLKQGDSLVGSWFSDLAIYPLAAWSRPDAGRTMAVRERTARQQLEALVAEESAPLLPFARRRRSLRRLRGHLAEQMGAIHRLPVQLPDHKRAAFARLTGSPEMSRLRALLDGWCGLWFWPEERAAEAPGPDQWYDPEPTAGKVRSGAAQVSAELAERGRFFHWELEFPDVFGGERPGFDAVVGNPPWDVLKPSAREFFGPGGAPADEAGLAPATAAAWRAYQARYRAAGHFVMSRREAAGSLTKRLGRALKAGPSAGRPYRLQGRGDLNLYKLFVEQSGRLCNAHGRLGLLVPAGLYADRGTRELREWLLDSWRWEWLVGFENRRRLFPIDGRFRFAAVVAQRGGTTESVRVSFMNQGPEAWLAGELETMPYDRELLQALSPRRRAFVETASARQLALLERLHGEGTRLGAKGRDGWPVRYVREFDAGNRGGTWRNVREWEADGFARDSLDRWVRGDETALPVVQGVMVDSYRYASRRWMSGTGKRARWEPVAAEGCRIGPQFLMPGGEYRRYRRVLRGFKVAVRRITSATNARTVLATLVPDLPCTDKAPVLRTGDVWADLSLLAVLNSFVLDFAARTICTGANLDRHHLFGLPLPARSRVVADEELPLLVLRLVGTHARFAPLWLEAARRWPALRGSGWRAWWVTAPAQRRRLRAVVEARVARLYGLGEEEMAYVLRDCGHPAAALARPGFARGLDPRGFWRVDRELAAKERLPALTLAALGGGVGVEEPTLPGTQAGEGWAECARVGEELRVGVGNRGELWLGGV